MGDPPYGRVPEQGPDWFLVATEACGGGTPDLGFFLEVWVYIGGRGTSGEPRGAHEGGGRAPLPRDLLADPPTCTPSLLGFFPSKNEFREVSGQLDSV